MGFKPSYANICHNCGENYNDLILDIHIDKADFNYCPICGNELEAPKGGNML